MRRNAAAIVTKTPKRSTGFRGAVRPQRSWTYPTVGEQSKVVYITATDSVGLKGQIPFQLDVNDQPPEISNLKVKPKKVKASGKRVELKGKKKPQIKFNLSEPAKVKFTAKLTSKKKKGKRKKSFSKQLPTAGGQKVKLKTKGLAPGKWKLTAQATDSAGLKGGKKSTKFKIKG